MTSSCVADCNHRTFVRTGDFRCRGWVRNREFLNARNISRERLCMSSEVGSALLACESW